MSHALVTGGSGYFGSLLVERLLAAGHAVRVLDLNDAHDRPRSVELVQGDIRDPEVVRAALADIDVVYNNVAARLRRISRTSRRPRVTSGPAHSRRSGS